MVKQADSGPWSILAAIVAPLAAAAARFLFERRRRSPHKEEQETMCRNHSHMTGILLEAASTQDQAGVTMLVTQDLTLEILNGEKLIIPRYSVCFVLRDNTTLSVGKRLHETEEPESLQLRKVGNLFSSGHIAQGK